MKNIFFVADYIKEGKTDSECILNCFYSSKEFKNRIIIFDKKDWFLDEAILIPSHTTIIIDGVKIKQNDYVFDNVFRADNMALNPKNPNGYPISISKTSHIKIIGKNGAIIEGPEKNGTMMHPTFKEEQLLIGDYWGWRGFQILFSICEDFEISGLTFYKQRSWAISVDRSKNGYFHDLAFYSTVKNGDGLNIRVGCNNILIENITGDTTDDLVAINSIESNVKYPYNQYVFPLVPSTIFVETEEISERFIHHIIVQNITTYAVSGVALISRYGNKIFDVLIQNVMDLHTEPFVHPLYEDPSKPNNLKLVYSYKGYNQQFYTAGDISNIVINNVTSNFFKYAVDFGDVVLNIWLNNILQKREDGEILGCIEQQNPNEIKLTNIRKSV